MNTKTSTQSIRTLTSQARCFIATSALLACGEYQGNYHGGTQGKSANADQPTASDTSIASAVRAAERGEPTTAEIAQLEVASQDADAPLARRVEATAALANAQVASNQQDSALTTLEKFLESLSDEARRGDEVEPVQQLLYRLLTGKEFRQARRQSSGPIANLTGPLLDLIPHADNGVKLSVLSYGISGDRTNALLNFSDYLHQEQEKKCSFCDRDVRSSVHSSRSGNWLGLVGEKPENLQQSLVLMFMSRDASWTPARYLAPLGLDAAAIDAMVKPSTGAMQIIPRADAPPVVLVAVDREAQLEEAIDTFAALREVPTTLSRVSVSPSLRRSETQSALRTVSNALLQCYKDSNPTQPVKTVVRVRINPNGTTNPSFLEGDLTGTQLGTCLETAIGRHRFPETGEGTTVMYPLQFTP